jgi:cytochrome c oxidase subunit IV
VVEHQRLRSHDPERHADPSPLGRQSAISQSLEREGRSYNQPIFFINNRCLHVRGHSKTERGSPAVLLGILLADIGSLLLHFGPCRPIIPLLIAVAQAILVILFFMHVRSSPQLIWLLVGAGFLWLGTLLVLVVTEYASRPWFRG